jgi:hypothetical protein
MRLLKKLIIIILLAINPFTATAQNWMMAQHYMLLAIDSLIQMRWPSTGSLAGFNIIYLEYDEILQEYTIQFTDTIECDKQDIPLKNGEKPDVVVDSGELTVSLTGGISAYEDENGEITVLELPDLSEVVYIFNDVGKEISFSLSDDDENFEDCTLKAGDFYFFPCLNSDSAFIKLVTVINNIETGNVHYKLVKAKGYRVRFDSANSRFEVYPDERMSLDDFKE